MAIEGVGCWGSKQENAKNLKALLESLKEKITEIKRLEVGINFAESETSSDVVLYSEFATQEALDLYQKHPEHLNTHSERIPPLTEITSRVKAGLASE